jgi:TetR/AcrR family transcriptional regulator, multidrug resistance operon repressor
MRTRDESKEAAIRQKALEMIVKHGFDGFSMQKLARAASVSPATIYIYFKDREDLLLQLCQEVSQKMMDATLKDFDPAMSFSEGLKLQWINRARYCMENQIEMLFLEQIRNSPLYEKSMALINERFKTVMGEFVHRAIEKKELVEVPIEVYWSIAFAPLYMLVKFHNSGTSIGGRQFRFSEEIMTQTLAIVLKGLKP